jgi:uncharacterized protein (TIGR02466 family)
MNGIVMTFEVVPEVVPLFSMPVYVAQEAIPLDTSEYIKSLDYHSLSPGAPGWISRSTYILDDPFLANIRELVQKHIDNYTHEMLQVNGDVEFYLLNSWVILHEKGDFSHVHNHQNSVFSGILYVDTPSDDDSVISFHSPDQFNIFPCAIRPTIKEPNIFISDTWQFKPKVGSLLLFPSTLHHSVSEMTSDRIRCCLPFNIFVRGKMGEPRPEGRGPVDRLVLK